MAGTGLPIRRTGQFKKDARRARKRGRDLEKLASIVETLSMGQQLDSKHRDHPLVGAYRGARECHIEPDWLLIYERSESELILIRTGSHSDLF